MYARVFLPFFWQILREAGLGLDSVAAAALHHPHHVRAGPEQAPVRPHQERAAGAAAPGRAAGGHGRVVPVQWALPLRGEPHWGVLPPGQTWPAPPALHLQAGVPPGQRRLERFRHLGALLPALLLCHDDPGGGGCAGGAVHRAQLQAACADQRPACLPVFPHRDLGVHVPLYCPVFP